jgi:hypothetical protein
MKKVAKRIIMYLKKRKTFSGENLVAGSKSLWVEETRVPGENYRSTASH